MTATNTTLLNMLYLELQRLYRYNSFQSINNKRSQKPGGGRGGSMSQVVGSNNSYKPITNTTWVRARLCKLHKGCTRLTAASDNVYKLLAHGWLFSPGTPVSSTTKTGCHDIAEILLKVALKYQKSKNQIPETGEIQSSSLVKYKYMARLNEMILFRAPMTTSI